jgi:NtrC-family two-component system response regulator AlgB
MSPTLSHLDQSDAGRILLVDDEPALLTTFRLCLGGAGHEIATATSADEAERIVQERVFDLCLLDLRLGATSALDLLPKLRAAAPWMRIVIVTAHSSVPTAVEAIRAGAVDFLVKPCPPDQLRRIAARHVRERRLEWHLRELERAVPGAAASPAESRAPAMLHLLETARRAADSDAAVLLLGESGTGKGVLARAIHEWSPRAAQPFVTVNGPGLAPELFESVLFGHRRGAFTGAVENAPGRISLADRGTLFLDEIGDVPTPVQPKLLRFLQDHQYERLGDATTRQADVRLIAATNRDLDRMTREGRFRDDLLYRIDVIRLQIPPLRERREDIVPMAMQFLAEFASRHGRRPRDFSDRARAALLAYAWPGNIRELRNVVERASILGKEERIDASILALGAIAPPSAGDADDAPHARGLDAVERDHIAGVIATTRTLKEAAHQLGIDASTLYRKRRQYGL